MTLRKGEKECKNDPQHDATGAGSHFWSLSHFIPVPGTWGASCHLGPSFSFLPTHPAAFRRTLLGSIHAPLSLQGAVKDLCSRIRPLPRNSSSVLGTPGAIEERLGIRVSSAPYNCLAPSNLILRPVTTPTLDHTEPTRALQLSCYSSIA